MAQKVAELSVRVEIEQPTAPDEMTGEQIAAEIAALQEAIASNGANIDPSVYAMLQQQTMQELFLALFIKLGVLEDRDAFDRSNQEKLLVFLRGALPQVEKQRLVNRLALPASARKEATQAAPVARAGAVFPVNRHPGKDS